MNRDQPIIEWVLNKGLAGEFVPVESLTHWKELLSKHSADWRTPFERALAFGFMADRVAYAFIAGFRAALQHLIPTLAPDVFASFCVTEEGGNHPKAIKTRLEPDSGLDGEQTWRLNGKKTFITGAKDAKLIFAAASAGVDEAGHNRIKLVQLDRQLPGIEIQSMAPLSFIPEIEHGTVVFTNVAVASDGILPGDGYTRYVKPFRIIEEIHVMASLLGYLIRLAFQYSLGQSLIEQQLALIVLARSIAESNLQSVQTHVVFAGFRQQLDRFITDLNPYLTQLPAKIQEDWLRDRSLLKIAEQARIKRLANAWFKLNQDAAC